MLALSKAESSGLRRLVVAWNLHPLCDIECAGIP